jgi:hypothetical protein
MLGSAHALNMLLSAMNIKHKSLHGCKRVSGPCSRCRRTDTLAGHGACRSTTIGYIRPGLRGRPVNRSWSSRECQSRHLGSNFSRASRLLVKCRPEAGPGFAPVKRRTLASLVVTRQPAAAAYLHLVAMMTAAGRHGPHGELARPSFAVQTSGVPRRSPNSFLRAHILTAKASDRGCGPQAYFVHFSGTTLLFVHRRVALMDNRMMVSIYKSTSVSRIYALNMRCKRNRIQ